ncbi:hypothetical protein D3C75_553060 [compost metagenome]
MTRSMVHFQASASQINDLAILKQSGRYVLKRHIGLRSEIVRQWLAQIPPNIFSDLLNR